MALIDTSYFVSTDLNIPNAGVSGSPIDSELATFLSQKEVEFLRAALGINLYRDFATAFGMNASGAYSNVASGKAADTVDQKWKDLLNGKEYTGLDGRLHYYPGIISLKDDARQSKQSPIAWYTYFYFVRKKAIQLSSTGGAVSANSENAAPASILPDLSRVWKMLGDWCWSLYEFLQNNTDTYSEWEQMDGQRMLKRFGLVDPFGGHSIGVNPYF